MMLEILTQLQSEAMTSGVCVCGTTCACVDFFYFSTVLRTWFGLNKYEAPSFLTEVTTSSSSLPRGKCVNLALNQQLLACLECSQSSQSSGALDRCGSGTWATFSYFSAVLHLCSLPQGDQR